MNILDNKEKFNEGLNTALYAFDQLEILYREIKTENEILWKVMLDNGNIAIWNALFTAMVDNRNDSTNIIIKIIRQLLEHDKYSLAVDGLKHLLRVPSHEAPAEFFQESVSFILDNLFSMNISDLDEMDRLSMEMMTWMKKISGSELGEIVHEYLHYNKVKLNQLIADNNSPDVILTYLSTLLAYDLYSPLRDMMKYLLDEEWPFLDSKIQEEQFAHFLWISSYLSMDAVMLERSNKCRRFIEQVNVPEILLYKIFCDAKDTWEDGDQTTSENIVGLMNQCSLFEEFEKEKLWEEVIRFIEKQEKAADVPQFDSNMKKVSSIWQIKNSTDHCPHCSQSKLIKEKFLVNGYKKKSEQPQKQVVFELLICDHCQRIYSYDSMNKSLNRALEPYRINVNLDPIEYPPKKVATKMVATPKNTELKTHANQKVNGYFAWPSTEAQESKGASGREGNFKEETDLHRLGYKITGLNRRQRWEILVRKAIPKLTLKEIVYTIAQNVRLRKSQAGGKTKFAYAISEWEHDLNRIKQEYYKSNFTWPQY